MEAELLQLGRVFSQLFEEDGEQQRPGVVVGAVALGEVGNGVTGVLKQAGAVAHALQVVQAPVGQLGLRFVEGTEDHRPGRNIGATTAGMGKRGHVLVGDLGPDHVAAHEVGLFAHGMTARLVAEQADDLARQGRGVPEGHQHAAALRQQLLGVPVRGRDHRLAAAKSVGQGAGSDLGRIEIRSDVDVGGAEEFLQLAEFHEAIVKEDLFVDAQAARQSFQADPITLALLAEQVGMRCSQDDIDQVGKLTQHRRQGLEHELDALVGRQQTKGQDDVLGLHAKQVLVEIRIDKRHVGNAVGDQVDAGLGDRQVLLEQGPGPVGHDDDPGGQLRQLLKHALLVGLRIAQDGVQGGDDRHAQLPEQAQNVTAGRSSEDAELVLQTNNVGVAEIEEIGDPAIGIEIFLLDLETDLGRIVVAFGDVVHRDHETVGGGVLGGHRGEQVVSEGGNPAAARQIIADKCDLADFGAVLHGITIEPEDFLLPSVPLRGRGEKSQRDPLSKSHTKEDHRAGGLPGDPWAGGGHEDRLAGPEVPPISRNGAAQFCLSGEHQPNRQPVGVRQIEWTKGLEPLQSEETAANQCPALDAGR